MTLVEKAFGIPSRANRTRQFGGRFGQNAQKISLSQVNRDSAVKIFPEFVRVIRTVLEFINRHVADRPNDFFDLIDGFGSKLDTEVFLLRHELENERRQFPVLESMLIYDATSHVHTVFIDPKGRIDSVIARYIGDEHVPRCAHVRIESSAHSKHRLNKLIPISVMHKYRNKRSLSSELSHLVFVGYSKHRVLPLLIQSYNLEYTFFLRASLTPQVKAPGVASNFDPSEGTGAGSTAQETPNISFSGNQNVSS